MRNAVGIILNAAKIKNFQNLSKKMVKKNLKNQLIEKTFKF